MLKYGFFNSVNGDRKYNADDMTRPYRLIVSDGIIANQSGQLSDSLKVKYAGGRQVKVISGNGMFGGHWLEMTADEILNVPTPHTQYTRIDAVVIRVDEDLRTLSLKYIQGTPNASPVAPTMQRSNTIKDYRLANITVLANTTEITQSNISDTRPSSDCGIVTNLLQNSDISSTFEQWESQFNDWLSSKQNDYENFVDTKQNEYNNFVDDYKNYINEQKTEYEKWLTEQKAKQEEWFELVKHSLADITPAQQFTNYVVIGENDDKQTIPIDMSTFNMTSDILKVYVNGMFLAPTHEYIVNGFESITLVNPVDSGTKILFEVIKTNGANIDPDYIEALWEQIQGE